MTRAEKIDMLNNLFLSHDGVIRHINTLSGVLSPDPGCAFYEAIFKLLDIAVNATEVSLGDTAHWVNWMVYENDCGHRGHEAGYTGNTKPIRTADDLLQLIEDNSNADTE
jgi:hypothetical protein